MTGLRSPQEWKTLLPPFLFGAASIVFLFSKNVGQVPAGEAAAALVLILLGIFLVLWLSRRMGWNSPSFSIMFSLAIFSLLNYGQIYLAALPIVFYPLKSQRPDFPLSTIELLAHGLLIALLILAGCLTLFLIRRRAALRRFATEFLLLLSALLVLVPAIDILKVLSSRPADSNTPTAAPASGTASADAPDIYYFILDGYAREDILEDVFQYDNTSFLTDLEARGFFLVDGAESNYSQTTLSLASTWNMEYLDTLVPGYSPDLGSQQAVNILQPYLREPRVLSGLRASGYRSYAFASGYPPTEWTGADEFLQPSRRSSGLMESLLIETTGLRFAESAFSLFGWPFPYPGYRLHRERLEYAFDTLPDLIGRPGPKIVITHLMAPHPPFVVDAEGNEIPPRSVYRLADGSDFAGTFEEYVEGYRGELTWVNRKMTGVLDAILSRSAKPPIIILQADHGAGARMNLSDPQPEGMRDRLRILTALYLPGDGRPDPYPTMTPVNIFRLLFDRYLGTAYGFLPDCSYFSSPYFPFTMIFEETSPSP